jgi:hypothetical protein
VSQFIHQGNFRFARQHRVEVHFLDVDASVLNLPSRNDFQSLGAFSRFSTPVRFEKPDDDIDALLPETMSFHEHLPRLSNSRPIAKINLEPAKMGTPDELEKAESLFT